MTPRHVKADLDAMTDASLAAAAEQRKVAEPLTRAVLPVAANVAAVIAEQFGDHPLVAGRAAMACSQMLGSIIADFEDELTRDEIAVIVPRIFALAAEQVVWEAGAQ
jgi:hypothetical protein